MRIVAIDTEFTGLHAFATLISVGLVTLEGDQLYVSLNDFDRAQVFPWLQENVLNQIDASRSISRAEAYQKVHAFLSAYSQGEPISLISPGKLNDLILLFELYHAGVPGIRYFHHSHLPAYLRHRAHFDLDTLFLCGGLSPSIEREEFVAEELSQNPRRHDKHHALYDAEVVRLCVLKLLRENRIPYLTMSLEPQGRPKQ